MKVKELAEILGKVNPEAEFQVIVSGYPQEFTLTHGGSEGCTLATCDDFGPMVNEGEDSEQEQPEKTKEEEVEAEAPPEDDLMPEELDFNELIGQTFDEVRETLEYYGLMDYELDPVNCSLELRYWTMEPEGWVEHTVRIEQRS